MAPFNLFFLNIIMCMKINYHPKPKVFSVLNAVEMVFASAMTNKKMIKEADRHQKTSRQKQKNKQQGIKSPQKNYLLYYVQ